MPPNQLYLLELAQKGDSNAIAALMNQTLQPKGISAKVEQKDGYLQVLLKSEQPMAQKALVGFITQGITKLNLEAINSIAIYARRYGQTSTDWAERIQLKAPLAEVVHASSMTEVETQENLQVSLPTKTPKKGDVFLGCGIVIAAFFALGLLLSALFSNLSKPQPNTAIAPSPVQSTTVKPSTPKAEDILSRVARETEHETRIDTWGQGKALFIVESGWKSLSDAEKNSVISYVQQNGGSKILVGRLKRQQPKNAMYIDSTVWEEASSQSSPPTASLPEGKCTTASGNMWTGVRVYLDSECKKPFATIQGGTKSKNSGERAVVLQFDSGSTEIKTRSAVADQAYVMDNDPALQRMQWQEF